MNKDLTELIEKKENFIKTNRGSKDPNIKLAVARNRQLIFALKKHKGICPKCGVNPICLGLAKNALAPICSDCESARRYESKIRTTYEQVLIEAVNAKPLTLAI